MKTSQMKLLPLCAGLLAALGFSFGVQAQGVGIGTAGAPDASAVLEARSTTQGVLFPRLTSAQRAAIAAPVAGLMVFQTDFGPGMYYYNGTAWLNLTTGTQASTTAVVSTLAGSGTAGFADGTGTNTQFNGPTGVACDGNGNVFVADQSNRRIRRIVAATGVVSTLAGSGTAGFANGAGAAAQFGSPYGVACDGGGNVFVADQGNHRIRQIVAATGVVSTLAGSGTAGFADGASATAQFNNPYGVAYDGGGNVFVADLTNNRIRVIR